MQTQTPTPDQLLAIVEAALSPSAINKGTCAEPFEFEGDFVLITDEGSELAVIAQITARIATHHPEFLKFALTELIPSAEYFAGFIRFLAVKPAASLRQYQL